MCTERRKERAEEGNCFIILMDFRGRHSYPRKFTRVKCFDANFAENESGFLSRLEFH